ncbi:unnamed protein product [Mucor fragilis]
MVEKSKIQLCNVLNLDTKNWTRQTIDAPAETALQRSRRSSVLVNSNTFFVMWGIDPNKAGTTSVLVLNTADPDIITMPKQYIDPNASTAAEGSNATENSNGNKVQPHDGTTLAPEGLSTGAKAGIIVAAVAVAILSALVIWFYLRRIRNQEHELTKQH